MELRQYIAVIKKNILISVVATVLGAVVAFYFSLNFQAGYKFEQTFFLSSLRETSTLISPQETSADTPQNSYYSLEKARDFTDSAVAILQSPDFTGSLDTKGSVAARKLAPQVIKITTIEGDRQSAKSAMGKVASSFNAKIKELQPSSTLQINTIGKVPDPEPAGPSSKIVLAFGAAFGFVVSLIAIGLKTYFRL
ncbi:MAG: hypothetical protein Q7S45_02650 [Candidatus Curtissbacteria bacterium]|nr:hypothetical protein [Candidatus Curtissbacteria bacterium]